MARDLERSPRPPAQSREESDHPHLDVGVEAHRPRVERLHARGGNERRTDTAAFTAGGIVDDQPAAAPPADRLPTRPVGVHAHATEQCAAGPDRDEHAGRRILVGRVAVVSDEQSLAVGELAPSQLPVALTVLGGVTVDPHDDPRGPRSGRLGGGRGPECGQDVTGDRGHQPPADPSAEQAPHAAQPAI
jgi:hypothetical protein